MVENREEQLWKGRRDMCGRFYIDDDTAREIERVIRIADEKIKRATVESGTRDIHPSDKAPVLVAGEALIACEWFRWGFPGSRFRMLQEKTKLVINARSETVLERPMFRESILRRRAVIPAAGFYEWNSQKERSRFFNRNGQTVFMAGCYQRFEDGEHFVILTTRANNTMKPVHDRMPLLLEPEEVREWLLEDCKTEKLLHGTPRELFRTSEYSQISMFD